MQYFEISQLRSGLREQIRAPQRMTVAEAAEQYLVMESSGGASPWLPGVTPYMLEPMNTCQSRLYDSVIFVGPARTGKTAALVLGNLVYSVQCDPVGDMMATFPNEANARKFGRTDIRKLHRYSPAMQAKLSSAAHDTAVSSTIYRNGFGLFLGYPTGAQLAQTTYRRVILSDYDSMSASIGDEGEPFGLALKRVETFLSSGICIAESSPKRLITDAKWQASSMHEAPPTDGGILPLYNMGDRRLLHWRCLSCHTPFLVPALPSYADRISIQDAADSAHVVCPHCGVIFTPSDKAKLNLTSAWIAEPGGGRNRMASFWMRGCASAYQTWDRLVAGYLRAKRRLETVGDEELLKKSFNTDQGLPYLPLALGRVRTVSSLRERAEDLDRRVVPDRAWFLLAQADVQAARFVVQITAVGPGAETWIIDRFDLDISERKTPTGDPTPIAPDAHIEDWMTLLKRTLQATYHGSDGSVFAPAFLGVDSGGRAGVTAMAYRFWRAAARGLGFGDRVMLTKGRESAGAPRMMVTYPDSARKDRHSKARGEIPVWLMNVTPLKDDLSGALAITARGPRYLHIPRWLTDEQIAEITAEVRTAKRWEKSSEKVRNEGLDLLVIHTALLVSLDAETWGVDWLKAPKWAHRENQVPRDHAPVKTVPAKPKSAGLGRDDWVL